MITSTRVPGFMGKTPEDVPQAIRSPGTKVMQCDKALTICAGEKIIPLQAFTPATGIQKFGQCPFRLLPCLVKQQEYVVKSGANDLIEGAAQHLLCRGIGIKDIAALRDTQQPLTQ